VAAFFRAANDVISARWAPVKVSGMTIRAPLGSRAWVAIENDVAGRGAACNRHRLWQFGLAYYFANGIYCWYSLGTELR
jgi:hypothetical protein